MFRFGTKEKDLEDRVEDYVDQEGISTRQLNLALWYVRHHKKFFLTLAGLLAAASLALWGYSAAQVISLVFSAEQDKQNLSEFKQSNVSSPKVDYLANLDYGFEKIIASGINKYDLVGQITNQNPKVGLVFDYYFVVNGQILEKEHGFVLPGEQKYLVTLGQEMEYTPEIGELVIENLQWRKINPRLIPDWTTYRSDRLNFIISDKKFLSAAESGLSEKIRLSDLNFSATNLTAYNYLRVDFVIILRSGSSIVGVSKYVAENFASRAKEDVNLGLVGDFANVDIIDIIPEVNILDEGVFDKID